MKLHQTKVHTGGMLRCCIDTIINLDPETEFDEGQVVDCKHERTGNNSIVLRNGAWEYNAKGRSHPENIKDCNADDTKNNG